MRYAEWGITLNPVNFTGFTIHSNSLGPFATCKAFYIHSIAFPFVLSLLMFQLSRLTISHIMAPAIDVLKFQVDSSDLNFKLEVINGRPHQSLNQRPKRWGFEVLCRRGPASGDLRDWTSSSKEDTGMDLNC
jgi:hypothetical protein